MAHEIRLAANKERLPDFDDATPDQARQCVEFALALAQNLFVLPARIRRGQPNLKLDLWLDSSTAGPEIGAEMLLAGLRRLSLPVLGAECHGVGQP
jgi:hypothetical protein